MKKTKKEKRPDRSDKFSYSSVGEIKFKTKKKKSVKEHFDSFAEFLFEKEEKFVASTMRWITIKDEKNQNQHILIKKKDGTILGGMGGKHNGEKLDDVFDDLEDKRDDIEDNEEQSVDYNKEIEDFRKTAITSSKEIHDVDGLKRKDITSEEYDSIYEYTADGYTNINGLYRDYDAWSEEIRKEVDRDDYDSDEEYEDAIAEEISQKEREAISHADTISKVLKANKTKRSMITYRGMSPKIISKIKHLLEPGNEFEDGGFASSSTDPDKAEAFSNDGYVMEIHIPKGSRASSVKNLSKYSVEDEVLIDKGSSFLIKEVNHRKRTLVVELRQD